MIENQMSKIVQYIIRPKKQTYEEEDLGSRIFSFENLVYERHDLKIDYFIHTKTVNEDKKKITIMTSFFELRKKNLKNKRICVLNLHGNIGNRLSGFSHI